MILLPTQNIISFVSEFVYSSNMILLALSYFGQVHRMEALTRRTSHKSAASRPAVVTMLLLFLGIRQIAGKLPIGRYMELCMYSRGKLVMRSREGYFGVYFPSCAATRAINTKITPN